MQELKLTIPTKASEFRIKHFKAFSNPALITTELDRMYLLSLLLGVSINVIRQQSLKDIEKWLGVYEDALMQMNMTAEPPKEITINGKEYSRVDPKKVGYGWHMDFRSCNINDDPTRLACLFYFPKGEIYGAVDEHDNLINPIRDRYDDFKEHFPLDVFIQSAGFFLTKSVRSMRIYTVKRIAEQKVKNLFQKLRNFKTKKQLI